VLTDEFTIEKFTAQPETLVESANEKIDDIQKTESFVQKEPSSIDIEEQSVRISFSNRASKLPRASSQSCEDEDHYSSSSQEDYSPVRR